MTKLEQIQYPLFCLNKRPIEINYDTESKELSYKKYKYQKPIVFSYDKNKPLLEQLFNLWLIDEKQRFDFTCLNMTHVFINPPKWGIDNTGNIFDFKSKDKYIIKTRKIKYTIKDKIFLEGISYPFDLDELYVKQIDFSTFFCQTILIGGVWYIYKFVYNFDKTEFVKI